MTSDDLLERVDTIIDFLTEREDVYYVALEIAHQLRDEIMQAAEEQESE